MRRNRWLNLNLTAALLVFCTVGNAAGFDDRYTVRIGDFEGDGVKEVYVKGPPFVMIAVDDVPIVIPQPVRDFVLRLGGQGGFTINAISGADATTASQWPISDQIRTYVRDVNQDGVLDLQLIGVSSAIPGQFNQVVYASPVSGNLPPTLTSQNLKFTRFHEQVFGWLQNPNYFDINAPRKIVSVEPAQRYWYSSIRDVTNVYLMNAFLARCSQDNPNAVCAISDRAPPPPCSRSTGQYDEQGNFLGNWATDICQLPIHVIVYTPSSVQLQADYSVFDDDAEETTQIIDRINDGCPALPQQSDADRLATIVGSIYQAQVMAGIPPVDKMNQIPHEAFPGDGAFDTNDKTYHHYDHSTRICKVSEANCTLQIVRDQAFRRYTYPPFLLRANYVAIPGPSREVFVSAPGVTEYPAAYVLPAGPIVQQFVTSSPWAGAVQNITQQAHISYPGTISRHVQQQGEWIEVFTHGLGINRAMCSLNVRNRAWNILLGKLNDTYGPEAFGTLDKQIVRYWRSNYTASGGGAPSGPSGLGNPGNLPSPIQ